MTRTVLFGEVAEIIKGISYRSADYSNSENGIAFVNLKSVARGGGYNADGIKYYAGQIKSSQYVEPGDILIANTDLTQNREIIGSPIIMPNIGRNACFSLDLSKIIVTDTEVIDSRYLFYYLKSPIAREYMLAHSNGSTVMHLSVKAVPNMELNLPSLDQQKKIANILSSLDEKIELNRRMNETLEQLGQALFRHYFVDNPDAKNWKKRSLGEFFPVKTGKKDANFGTKDGKFPFFTCAQTISRAPSYSFDGSAILVAGNGDFNIKYYTGKFEAYQRTYVLIPHNEELLGFLYFLMKKDLSLITGGSRGSVIKFITKGMIENYRAELPDDNDLAAFAPIFSELLALISHSNEQIQTLAALRDALLPKLISGEIEV